MRNTEENLIRCQRALAPTGISIAPYVINPYRGCEFGCIYCYSQMNKCFQKNKRRWGEFVDVKINCLEVLERELKNIRPERILLGSTTEVYQPIEEKHSLVKGIIELLNRNNIPGFTDVEKIMEACYGITDRMDFESFNWKGYI